MQENLQNKKDLVKNVFNQVYNNYDLMNDLMSFGVHRIWKKNLINMMNPSKNHKLIDVACGTGDIVELYIKNVGKFSNITCVDPNERMIKKAKEKLTKFKNLNWLIASAENLPIPDNNYDFYTISFGLRNTKSIEKSISEAYRVLKPGGRFLCLEFSKIQNLSLDKIYKNYSRIIPYLGKIIVGEKAPYNYLIKSINDFVNQEQLKEIMIKNNFKKCSFRNLSGGIVAIHSGWKV